MAGWNSNRTNSDKQYFAQPVPVTERKRRVRSACRDSDDDGGGGGRNDQSRRDLLDDDSGIVVVGDEFQHSGEKEGQREREN